jgi:hypothetical protein
MELLRRFRSDFGFYAPRALRIRTKSGAIVPFTLNRAQQHMHAKLEQQLQAIGMVRALVLKGRQQGASTYIGGRFYWKTSGEFGKNTYILTHEQAATDNLFGMTKRYNENCPDELKPQTAIDNAKELWFNVLDSRYKVATAGAKATGRSGTAQYFHGSEAAFWPNAKDHMAGIGQTIPEEPGTEIILESTGNGIGNPFHQKWTLAVAGDESEDGESPYLPIFVPWYWEPGYRRAAPAGFVLDADEARYADAYDLDLEQMAWRRAKVNGDFEGDVSLFNQEYPATPEMAFMRGAERGLIGFELVAQARKPKPMFNKGAKVLGVDPAEYGRDKTALVFRQGRKVHWVTRYAKKGTMEIAGIVAQLHEDDGYDAIVVDVTGVGTGVADRLIEMQIPHVYRVHFGGKAYDDVKYVNRRAECWGRTRDWLLDTPCLLPDDDKLQADLTSVPYHYDSSRRLVLESKEKMARDGIPSPDSADALSLTFAEHIQPRRDDSTSWRDRLARHAIHGSAQAA